MTHVFIVTAFSVFIGAMTVVVINKIIAFLNRVNSQNKAIEIASNASDKPVQPKPEKAFVKQSLNSNWVYNEKNLGKAILKGRRQGHLQIMYHGNWHSTGLKLRES